MEKVAFNTALLAYLAASLAYFVYLVYRKQAVSLIAAGAVGVMILRPEAIEKWG